MSGVINDGHIVLGSLELPESNVDGDSTLALGLQLVHHPRILEGTLSRKREVWAGAEVDLLN